MQQLQLLFHVPQLCAFVQQSANEGNPLGQLFVPQIRPLSHSESLSQSPSSFPHGEELVQQAQLLFHVPQVMVLPLQALGAAENIWVK